MGYATLIHITPTKGKIKLKSITPLMFYINIK